MDWWEKAVLPPMKRALAAVARVKPGSNTGGFFSLYHYSSVLVCLLGLWM